MPAPPASPIRWRALVLLAAVWLAFVVGARVVTPPMILSAYDGDSSVAWLNQKIANHKAYRAGAGLDASREWYGDWARGYAAKASGLATLGLLAGGAWFTAPGARRRVKRFLFASAEPLNLAVLRVAAFGMLLYLLRTERILYYAQWPRDLYVWPALAGAFYKFLPLTPEVVGPTLVVATVTTAMAVFGLFTRAAAVVSVPLGFYLIGIPQLSGKVNHVHHVLMIASVVACSRCGDALSLDAVWRSFRRADRGRVAPVGPGVRYGLPIRLAMVILSLVYFFPGFWKLASNGPQWVFSNNLENHMLQKWFELEHYTPPLPLHKAPFFGPGGALFAVVFELGFPLALLWSGSRVAWAAMGLSFHNLTNLLMKISFVTLQAMYVMFVDWQRLLRWVGRSLFGEPICVLYDGNCGLCRRTIAVLGEFDWLRQLRPINALDRPAVERAELGHLEDAALMQDMHAAWRSPSGEWGDAKGYAAYQRIAWRVPVLWPTLPLIYLPPVAAIGRRVYRRVADSRACRVPSAPSGSAPPARDGLPWSWRPLATVATLLIGGLCVMGALRLHKAWPIACYPLFDQLELRTTVWPEFELRSADGSTRTLDDDPIRDALGEARYVASMEALASTPVDEAGARLILRQFVTAWRAAGALPEDESRARRLAVTRATYELSGPGRPAAPVAVAPHFEVAWSEIAQPAPEGVAVAAGN